MSLTTDQKRTVHALMQLPQQEDKVQCLYLWIDGSLKNFRCKSMTWNTEPNSPQDLPSMEFCGSATDFDVGNIADYYSWPVRLYRDPFRRSPNKMVLCETYCREGLPTFANNRYRLLKALENKQQDILTSFVFDQSYSLLRKDGLPLSYMDPAFVPNSKVRFACGRGLAESHYRACLYSGVRMSSLEHRKDAQWRYSIGPCLATELCDDVWTSRFLLERVAEDFGLKVDFQMDSNLRMDTTDIPHKQRHMITDAFLSKFLTKETKPVKVQTRDKNTVLSGCHGDVDTYALVTKVLEAVGG